MVVKKVKNKEYCNRNSIYCTEHLAVYAEHFLRCPHIHVVTYRQTTDRVYGYMQSNFAMKTLFFVFLAQKNLSAKTR